MDKSCSFILLAAPKIPIYTHMDDWHLKERREYIYFYSKWPGCVVNSTLKHVRKSCTN